MTFLKVQRHYTLQDFFGLNLYSFLYVSDNSDPCGTRCNSLASSTRELPNLRIAETSLPNTIIFNRNRPLPPIANSTTITPSNTELPNLRLSARSLSNIFFNSNIPLPLPRPQPPPYNNPNSGPTSGPIRYPDMPPAYSEIPK